MESVLASPYILLFARLTLGGIFLFGAVGKLLDPAGSRAAVTSRRWLPRPLAVLTALILPWLEAAVGLALLLGLGLGLAAWGALVLLVVFTGVVLGDLAQGGGLECHCFGRFSHEQVSRWTVARNLALMALAALVAWHPTPYLALDAFARDASGLPSAINAVPVVFLALLAVVAVVLGSTLVATIRGFLRAF